MWAVGGFLCIMTSLMEQAGRQGSRVFKKGLFPCFLYKD